MKIDVLTLFPMMFPGVIDQSMLKRAREKEIAEINIHNLRDWTYDNHKTVDDKPYGGGPGMVLKIEPVDRALADIKDKALGSTEPHIILTTPQGERFNQGIASDLSKYDHIIIVCGHYEGYDERIRSLVDREISIGDYVLTCGEIPAMVLCDSIIRLIPGVLGDSGCLEEESFENGSLEYPQYTRPSEYNNMRVPEVLLCGDPKKINQWKKEQSLKRTKERRPDLVINNS